MRSRRRRARDGTRARASRRRASDVVKRRVAVPAFVDDARIVGSSASARRVSTKSRRATVGRRVVERGHRARASRRSPRGASVESKMSERALKSVENARRVLDHATETLKGGNAVSVG